MSIDIHFKCPRCSGTGYSPPGSVSPENICNHCQGTGYDDWGHLEYDLDSKFSEIDSKFDALDDKLDDILDLLNP